jgi:hypothetical protein
MRRDRWARAGLRAVRASLVVLLAAAAVSVAAPHASAGTGGWSTTTAVVPGETLTIDVTVPDVNIANSTTIATCPITGLGTDFITYTCDPLGLGIPAGTHMLQTWSDPKGNPLSGPFSEQVVYNAYGPLQKTLVGPNDCTSLGSEDPYTLNWSCEIALPTYHGSPLYIYVLADDRSLIVTALHESSDIGCIPFSEPATTPGLDDLLSGAAQSGFAEIVVGTPGEVVGNVKSGSGVQLELGCGGVTIPANATIEFDSSSSATAHVTIAEEIDYFVPDSPPPSPTKQTIYANTPALISINPTSGPAGSTVTLTGTNLTAFAVSFGGTPGVSHPIGPSRGSTVAFSSGAPPASSVLQATNVVCNAAGTSCTASTPSNANPGTQSDVSLTTSAGTSNSLTFTTTAAPAPASTPGP